MSEPVRASRRKYHIIYKTTCLVTGRYYIGMHSTDDLEDGYLGSGLRLKRSVKKYGRDQHVRKIIEVLPTRQAASEREKELITEDLRADPMCLNCGVGGLGAVDRPVTKEETRQKMSDSHKRNNADPLWKSKRWQNHKDLMNKPENIAKNCAAQSIIQNKPEQKALRSRPCTVDGVTIFESIKALCAALGKGKAGLRSPSFKFIEPNGPVKNAIGILNAWADPKKKAIRLTKRQETLNKKLNK